MSTDSDLLDLSTVMSRAEKVRFDVVDAAGLVVGALHPEVAPTISNDTSGQIKRSLSGLRVAASEYNSFDPLRHRLRPYWVLSTGTEYPLGVFMAADAQTQRYSYGTVLTAPLVDQGRILGQQVSATLSWPAGTTAQQALTDTVQAAGIYNAQIAPTTYTFGTTIGYPAGSSGTTYAKVLDDLCSKAGYYNAYFDNSGTLTIRNTVPVASVTPTLQYIDGGRIVAGSITESNDLLAAPNRFLVIDTSATTGAIAYIWDIPDSAPHSYANTGYRKTKTIEAPGVGNVSQAQAVAQAFYSSNPQAYATAVWSSPADPRHDTFDIVNYRGSNYLETKWSLTLAPGGPMTHTAIRVYL